MSFKLNYIIIPALVAGVAGVGGWLTSLGRSADNWYQMLQLPLWAPGGDIISTAWTIIFILTAISLLIIWNKLQHHTMRFRYIIQLFVANAVFNIGWSYLFFIRHNLLAALIDAALILVSVLGIIILLYTYKGSQSTSARTAALLLYPYAGWVLLATYLTYTILTLN